MPKLLGTPKVCFDFVRWHIQPDKPLGIGHAVVDQFPEGHGCPPHGEEQWQTKVCSKAAHIDRSRKGIVIPHGVEHQRFGQFTGIGSQEYRAWTSGRS